MTSAEEELSIVNVRYRQRGEAMPEMRNFRSVAYSTSCKNTVDSDVSK